MGGSSHGSYLASNLFTMFNDNIDGANFQIGSGPCANEAVGEQDVGWLFHCNRREDGYKFSTSGMKGKDVYIFGGMNDTIVDHRLTAAQVDYFKSQGANVKSEFIHEFGHVFPNSVQSDDFYNPPRSCAPRFDFDAGIVQCGYNLAYEIFAHLYGENITKDTYYQDSGKLYTVDQTPFNIEGAHLADQGFLYVPDVCFNESCNFHVEFHGCNSSIGYFKDINIKSMGQMEFAAQNKIIILYPQSGDSGAPDVEWMFCWRSAMVQDSEHPQIVAISKMIEALFDKDLMNEGVRNQTEDMQILSSVMNNMGPGPMSFMKLNPFFNYATQTMQCSLTSYQSLYLGNGYLLRLSKKCF